MVRRQFIVFMYLVACTHGVSVLTGTYAEFSTTGTTLRFKPGLLQGSSVGSSTGTGKIVTHDCGTERSIGWFIEGEVA
jgi:hypothetical protein